MHKLFLLQFSGSLVILSLVVGCHLGTKPSADCCSDNLATDEVYYGPAATEMEFPDADACCSSAALDSLAPRTVAQAPPTEYWDLTLAETIAIALENSKAMNDLGGRVVKSPDTIQTIYDPALVESDPRFGTEGALSAFDAQMATSIFWAKNDRAVNNITLGGGTREIRQDLGVFQYEVSKTAVTGSRFAIRNLTQYDGSNQPGNLFPSAWDTQWEAEVRQPLLQGAGTTFNRIAGPNAQPGFNFSNGVLIARVNTDISLANFEAGVRDFINDVETAYWDLHFAYHYFDANLRARDSALQTWQVISAQQGLPGGTAERVARASAQYFAYEGLVQDALSGNPRLGRSVGIYRGERRLRRLMGLAANDGRLIRPADRPPNARVVFAWEEALASAITHRVELRQQKWKIKRSELKLTAARNFLLPRFDTVARYRMRGFGDNLTGGGPQYSSAFQDLGTGDHQEWQVGLELTVPIGYRQAWAGVRQAELEISRDRAIYCEQQLQVSHEVGDAIAEVDRAHMAVQAAYNRLGAAHQRLEAAREVLKVDKVSVDIVLEAQQELSDAQTRYFESLRDYAVALKDVQLAKGTLLAYNGIFLNEGAWPRQAYADAAELSSRLREKRINYCCEYPGLLSLGKYQPGNALPPGPESIPVGEPDSQSEGVSRLPAPESDEAAPPRTPIEPLPSLQPL